MTVTSDIAPTTNPSNSGAGITNPTNVFVSDNAYSNITDVVSSSDVSGFTGFNIPAQSVIDGIEVQVECKNTGAGINHTISIVIKGTGSFSSPLTVQPSSTSDTLQTAGSSTNLWGRTWTTDDFLDGVFTLEYSGSSLSVTSMDVDQILVRVYYHAGNPYTLPNRGKSRPRAFAPGLAR